LDDDAAGDPEGGDDDEKKQKADEAALLESLPPKLVAQLDAVEEALGPDAAAEIIQEMSAALEKQADDLEVADDDSHRAAALDDDDAEDEWRWLHEQSETAREQQIATGEIRALDAQANRIAADHEKAEAFEVKAQARLAKLQGDSDAEEDEIEIARESLRTAKDRRRDLERQFGEADGQLRQKAETLQKALGRAEVAKAVDAAAALLPAVKGNKTIYATLLMEGKIPKGASRAQVLDLINAARVTAGKKPVGMAGGAPPGGKPGKDDKNDKDATDKPKSKREWAKRLRETLGAPARIGGGRGAMPHGKPKPSAGGADPVLDALKAATGAKREQLKQLKGGK
jgi:hypothetical protein